MGCIGHGVGAYPTRTLASPTRVGSRLAERVAVLAVSLGYIGVSAFRVAVTRVIGKRPFKEMRLPHARRVVTAVQDAQFGRPEGVAVRVDVLENGSGETEVAVAPWILAASPNPAIAEFGYVCRDGSVLIDLRPEPFIRCLRWATNGTLRLHREFILSGVTERDVSASPLHSILLQKHIPGLGR